MNEFLTVLTAVLPMFAIMGIGLGLRRRGWLSADGRREPDARDDQSASPVAHLRFRPWQRGAAAAGKSAAAAAGRVLAWLRSAWAWPGCSARAAGLKTKPERRTFAFLTGLQNYAYLTIPLCLTLFNADTTGVLFVHNVGSEIAMWTLGIAVLTGSGLAGGWKKILNAPLAALLLALALNFLGTFLVLPLPAAFAGKTILTAVHWFGQSAIPLALLLIGAIVADHLDEARGGGALRVVTVAALVRLGVMPALFLFLAKFLPCSIELKRVLILQGAMPSAVLPIVLTKHYGGDARTALQVALGTSVLGLVTIPLWIRFGEYVIGLK